MTRTRISRPVGRRLAFGAKPALLIGTFRRAVPGKPVIAIDTAAYLNALRINGIADRKEGFGRLMAEF